MNDVYILISQNWEVRRVSNGWQQVSKLPWCSDKALLSAITILETDEFVSYVEFENSGVFYRVIRQKNSDDYDIDLLNPQEQTIGAY